VDQTGRKPSRTRRILAEAALVPPFAAAVWSLFEPWAHGRVIGFLGVTRSIGAVLLVGTGLALALGACAAIAWNTRRMLAAGAVHAATGILLAGVSLRAFEMIRDAGVKALGLLPIASVRPGRGWFLFLGAAAWMLTWGTFQLVTAAVLRRRREPDCP